jgi:hypothetical protein
MFIYKSKDDANLLTVENFKKMKELENEVIN